MRYIDEYRTFGEKFGFIIGEMPPYYRKGDFRNFIFIDDAILELGDMIRFNL